MRPSSRLICSLSRYSRKSSPSSMPSSASATIRSAASRSRALPSRSKNRWSVAVSGLSPGCCIIRPTWARAAAHAAAIVHEQALTLLGRSFGAPGAVNVEAYQGGGQQEDRGGLMQGRQRDGDDRQERRDAQAVLKEHH